jgi:hypothetical protein
MIYAFLLFWPANIISPWLFITLLQFYIPMNMFFRTCVNKQTYFKIHFYSAFLILIGVGLGAIALNNQNDRSVSHLCLISLQKVQGYNVIKYAIFFVGSQVIDVISHSIKESLVRSQPMN